MKDILQRATTQLTRFSLVGVANTGIDFLVTNLLFLAFRPTGMAGLTLISLLACLVAATNSYLANSRWTFTDRANQDGQVGRFVVFAALGMVVNTAVFLFLVRYLPLLVTLDPVSNLNVAKLGGVVCALAVTFLGYRFGVFYSAAIAGFRKDCRLAPATGRLPWRTLARYRRRCTGRAPAVRRHRTGRLRRRRQLFLGGVVNRPAASGIWPTRSGTACSISGRRCC